MIGYQTGDDGVPGRGGVTTFHQSEVLHSLILFDFNEFSKSDKSLKKKLV